MLGSMASVALAAGVAAADGEARSLRDAIALEDRVEVPISPWPVPAARSGPAEAPRLALLRISCQRYVEDADIGRLIEVLARRGIANRAPVAPSAGAVSGA
jgi:hypothetical protein